MPSPTSLEVASGDISWPEVTPLAAEVYPPHILATLPWRDIVFAHADWRVLIRNGEGKLIAHVGIFLRTARVHGSPRQIAGIGGVMTHPRFRRQGFAGAALREARSFLLSEPRLVPFYARLECRSFAGPVFVEQPGSGSTNFTTMGAMVLDLAERAPAEGTIDLCGLPW
jgi:aminoglycoside 2'-N-acetyltransferase I